MKKLHGVHTALITPFFKGAVDLESFENLLTNQVQRGVQGFVVNGTTGENPTLSDFEHQTLFKTVKNKAPGLPVIYGTGSNSTAKTIEDTKKAASMGADAALVVVPYYNKPPQRGLYQHFISVADATKTPVILYNVPGRTITALELETIKKLSEHANIIGIKEASGNIEFAKQIRAACGPDFLLLSGDDATYDDFMKAGGNGAISVASHIIPEALLQRKASQYLDLINALFCEANPIPVKMALQLLKIIKSAELRLPLVTLADGETEKLKKEMHAKGLLS